MVWTFQTPHNGWKVILFVVFIGMCLIDQAIFCWMADKVAEEVRYVFLIRTIRLTAVIDRPYTKVAAVVQEAALEIKPVISRNSIYKKKTIPIRRPLKLLFFTQSD